MKSQAVLGIALLALVAAIGIATAAPAGKQPVASPKPQTTAQAATVSYEREVKPLLVTRCYACHGNGTRLGNFQLDSREGLLTGGNTHPVVSPGKGAQSYLIKLVSGQVPGKIMPVKGPRLTPAEVGLLTRWIDQGASYGAEKTASEWKPLMELRRPALPQVAGVTHRLDRLLHPYLAKQRPATRTSSATPVVDDRTFARRTYLDIIGLLPSPEELQAFLADPAPNKRARLAKALLADNKNYSEHWLTFWNDALRNDYAGTGYIDGGRLQITGWLQEALFTNKPYDRFVAELVNPTPQSLGFVKGIVWRGVVNASQTPEMQAAQNISQVFMGVNLKCASCHDSFIGNWKLSDAYGMASIYADAPLEMVRCDKPLGKVAPVKFLYPELGQIDGSLPKAERLARLAEVLTSKSNGRLARTLVNRIWGKLMGRGLVEPADEMDSRPWSPEVLDWLAADFVDHGWDVKHLIETIVSSRAYQMPSVGLPSEGAAFVFRGPVVKRMTAEQFVDGVSQLTGVWARPAVQFRINKGNVGLPGDGRAQIKFQTKPMRTGSAEIDVDVTGADFLFLIATDAGNGGASDWADWVEPRFIGPDGEKRLTDLKWRSATTGYGEIRINRNVIDKPLKLGDRTFENGLGTHADSVITYPIPPGTTRFRALAGPDTGAVEQNPAAATSVRFFVVTGDRSAIETRQALALADPLTRALGRPNREQVVTQRSPVATTLQALELTNGTTLAGILARGAERAATESTSPADVVDRLYQQALSRRPTASERAAALELVGTPLAREGIEDLLWALIMLPEYQLY